MDTAESKMQFGVQLAKAELDAGEWQPQAACWGSSWALEEGLGGRALVMFMHTV